MERISHWFGGALAAGLLSFSATTFAQDWTATILDDPYLWLEDVEGERALDWVRKQNDAGQPVLESIDGFADYRARAEAILAAKDRIAYPRFRGDHVYNFWQDEDHVRGIWRRASLNSYLSDAPEWETVLDIDALAEQDGENWVWKGVKCLGPDDRRCLVQLSRGGKDAVVLREFDVAAGAFVDGGFETVEAKTWFDWFDADTIMIGTDYGEGSLTESGYPRFLRLWDRGTPLDRAETIYEVPADYVWVDPKSKIGADYAHRLVSGAKTFWTAELHHVTTEGETVASPLPEDADYQTMFDGRVVALMRSDWTRGGKTYPRGSLVAYEIDPLLGGGEAVIESVYVPRDGEAIRAVAGAKSRLYIALLDNVAGRVVAASPGAGRWTATPVELPGNRALTLVSADSDSDRAFVNVEGFLTPDSLYLVEGVTAKKVKSLPPRFDAENLVVEQHFATSKDGTEVPYFLVRHEEMAFDGTTPTWIWSYGGFEIPLTPGYVAPAQQFWLEEGGAYVVANIRGGGEFGPEWHQAALLKNRQKAYDDFVAVAEDLIARKVTSPEKLGISGRSNGGLLMGVQLTQRPDLYEAIIIGVPLIDMLRYDKLLAGASWTGEYGDPDDPEMRDYILTYSPYQNLDPDADYPEVFIYTSTKDDRVHPGHARKLAARLMEQGHDILYYENIEGGHAGVANLKQAAYRATLEFAYMKRRLMDGAGSAKSAGDD